MEKIISLIANRIGLRVPQVVNTVKLLDEGATIPFISRYRKEMTGSMDEVEVMRVKFEYDKLKALVTRKAGILETIEEQGKLTPELKAKIEACYDPTDLEDLYLPYKPKRKTRSVVAREKGLEPLALKLFAQKDNDVE